MSDSLNNKELVAVGHQFAKAMSTDTPIIDMAKIVSRLAERLDCTTAALHEMTKQRDALGAENAGLKQAAEFAAKLHGDRRDLTHPVDPQVAAYEKIMEQAVPDGWVTVPVEPTEDMVIAGFEAELREEFRDPEAWEAFEAMSGCEQAAHRAKWCWAAMIKAAPQQEVK